MHRRVALEIDVERLVLHAVIGRAHCVGETCKRSERVDDVWARSRNATH